MNRPQIKLGLLHTIAPQFVISLLVTSWFVAGCVAQPGAKKQSAKKPAATLSAIAFDSFQARDKLRAVKLRAIADDVKTGRLKYDGPVMDAIKLAGVEASEESWKPVAEALQKLLGDGERLDAVKCEKAIRDLADGSEGASK